MLESDDAELFREEDLLENGLLFGGGLVWESRFVGRLVGEYSWTREILAGGRTFWATEWLSPIELFG